MHPTIQLALRTARSVVEHYEYVLERLDLARIDNELPELLATCGKRVEQAIERQLVRAHPDASLRGRHAQVRGSGDMLWVVDPLVGQNNLQAGYPFFALTLSIYIKDRLEHVVVINPATGQEYLASRGRGATLNGRRIRVTQGWHLEDAGLALPLPRPGKIRNACLPYYAELLQKYPVRDLYVSGCAELDLCAVAAGQVDAAIILAADETALAPYLLLLKEAGGLTGDLSGAPCLVDGGHLLATHPKAFRLLINPATRL